MSGYNKNIIKQALKFDIFNEIPPKERRLAAVAVIFFEDQGNLSLLFTKRSDELDEHAGQISFPGGALENDESFLEAALRETMEETGIADSELELIAALPTQPVLSKWIIFPFSFWWAKPRLLQYDTMEVAKVIVCPLSELIRQHNPHCHNIGDPSLACRYLLGKGELLWGATAKITGRLLDKIIDVSEFI